MSSYLLIIEYDGSGFHGWQRQPNKRTVQGELEDAIKSVTGEDVTVNGTSRTDAGVHALGQCLSFALENSIPPDNLKLALNNRLSRGKTISGSIPGDIRIRDCREVPEEFNARFDCVGKTYKYVISTGTPDAFRGKYCYFVNSTLDMDAMTEAAGYIECTHDFAAFQSAGGTPRETTVRTVSKIDIGPDTDDAEGTEGIGDISIRVTGDGFLYNMVRIIVGTLVEVGEGRRSPESVREAIESMDRSMAGHTAPAEGLYLERIYFE